ncbi:bactofilin family protein [Robiginitomaculum antarcticum]|uniref:bactofilin family protein n=1 Tax=Robiginitomaculum antarcticum TaxID=437507 RepID=UPI0004758BDD|nr:polymer-forming cytoskeletal protein [Robiginitomaculum antarcticum]
MFSKTKASGSSSTSTEMSKKHNVSRPQNSGVPSILAADLVVTGEIKTDGDVQIEGRLDGNIAAKTLTIGENGAVNGNIKAEKVMVHGKVTGNITASTIEFHETANVQADLIQDHLTIANGAFFDGKCSRKTKPGANIQSVAAVKAS